MALQTSLPSRKIKDTALPVPTVLPCPGSLRLPWIMECLWRGVFGQGRQTKHLLPFGICQPELALIRLTCVFGLGKF